MSLRTMTSSADQAPADVTPQVSRRGMLKRIGKFGVLATAGAGALELVGVSRASAAGTSSAPQTYGTITTPYGTYPTINGTPIISNSGPYATGSCKCTATLDEGACLGGHPCPQGYCCFYANGCGIYGPTCLTCGTCPRYCGYGCS